MTSCSTSFQAKRESRLASARTKTSPLRHLRDPVEEVLLDDPRDAGLGEVLPAEHRRGGRAAGSKPTTAWAMISAETTSRVWSMNSWSSSSKLVPKAVRRSRAQSCRLSATVRSSLLVVQRPQVGEGERVRRTECAQPALDLPWSRGDGLDSRERTLEPDDEALGVGARR